LIQPLSSKQISLNDTTSLRRQLPKWAYWSFQLIVLIYLKSSNSKKKKPDLPPDKGQELSSRKKQLMCQPLHSNRRRFWLFDSTMQSFDSAEFSSPCAAKFSVASQPFFLYYIEQVLCLL